MVHRSCRTLGPACKTALRVALCIASFGKTMAMSEQLAITLSAAAVGLVSAVFFCIGNAFNSAKGITLQSTQFWDYSEPVARALAAQRAQSVTGGLLLLGAFALQVWAAVASSTHAASLPSSLHTWPSLVLVVLVATAAVSWLFCAYIERVTIRRVLQKHAEALSANAEAAP